jgi:hypothetical protein
MKALILVAALAALVSGVADRRQGKTPRSVRTEVSPAIKAQPLWEGTYVFQEGEGGSFVEHTIKVYRLEGELIADLDAAGYQTSVSIRCDTKTEGTKISFNFRSYREDNIGEPYSKGQFLLSLERVGVGKRSKLLTNWGGYRPAFREPKGGGVYFKKTK